MRNTVKKSAHMKREDIPPSRANLMSGEQYRESLRQYKPVV